MSNRIVDVLGIVLSLLLMFSVSYAQNENTKITSIVTEDNLSKSILLLPLPESDKYNAQQYELVNKVMLEKNAFNPMFTPDKKKIIYTKRIIDKKTGFLIRNEIWTSDFLGKKKEFIVKGSHGSYSQKMDKLAYYDHEENYYGVFTILDLKSKKKYKIDNATKPPEDDFREIRWSKDDKYILFGMSSGDARYVNVFDLDSLKVVKNEHGNIDDYDDIWIKYNAIKNINPYINYYAHRGRGIWIKNRDKSYEGVLAGGWFGENIDLSEDFSKIVFHASGSRFETGIYIAKLVKTKKSLNDVIFKIDFGKSHDCYSELKRDYINNKRFMEKGFYEIIGDVYLPSINPLNNKILGPNPGGTGPIGQVKIFHLDDNYSLLKITLKTGGMYQPTDINISGGNVVVLKTTWFKLNENNLPYQPQGINICPNNYLILHNN